MIDARLSLGDVGSQPRVHGLVCNTGSSTVEVFAARHLSIDTGLDAGVTWVWAGEGSDPYPQVRSSTEVHRKHGSSSDLEGVKIVFEQEQGKPRITVVRTNGSRTPLYASYSDDTLTVSWRYERAVSGAKVLVPDSGFIKDYIEVGRRRVRGTVFQGIQSLWAGEAVVFDEAGVRFLECPVSGIVVPGTLRVSARATDAFASLIRESSAVAVAAARSPVMELSGGYDSTCVGLAVRSLRDDWSSYSVIQQGAAGRQQRERRRELLDILGANDQELDYVNIPGPIAALEIPENRVTTLDDNHRTSCATMLDGHPCGPFDVALTGIGGDELTMTDTFRADKDELPGSIATSASVAAAGRADLFMRRGIWPINPLTSQSVVDYCRALPQEMREGRALNTLFLARSGFSDGFIFPPYREHCGGRMMSEIYEVDYEKDLAGALLADLGIVDVASYLKEIRWGLFTDYTARHAVKLWSIYKVEAVLRRYMT